MSSPTDASPPPLRATAHGSGPMGIATPSSRRTCTDYSLPGLPAHRERFWTLPSRYDLLYLRQFSSRLERKQSEILHESDRIFYEPIGGSTAIVIPRRTRRRAVGAARAS